MKTLYLVVAILFWMAMAIAMISLFLQFQSTKISGAGILGATLATSIVPGALYLTKRALKKALIKSGNIV